MPLMTAAEARYGAAHENTLADQIARIDQALASGEWATRVYGSFLNFYDGSGLIAGVDSASMTGEYRAAATFSVLQSVSPEAFEAVAARMWRNMLARKAASAYQSGAAGVQAGQIVGAA